MDSTSQNRTLNAIRRWVTDCGISNTIFIRCFGTSYKDIRAKLSGCIKRHEGVRIVIHGKFPEVTIQLTAANQMDLDIIANQTSQYLGDIIISMNDKNMAECLGELLFLSGKTISVAESCTGGLIAHQLTQVPGSSSYFNGAAVTYSNESKQNILCVEKEIIDKFGAVHERTALAMAEGVRHSFNTTHAIATSGIAGPDGGSKEKPVGSVCIAMSSSETKLTRTYHFPDKGRDANKKNFALAAMDTLRCHLKETIGSREP